MTMLLDVPPISPKKKLTVPTCFAGQGVGGKGWGGRGLGLVFEGNLGRALAQKYTIEWSRDMIDFSASSAPAGSRKGERSYIL